MVEAACVVVVFFCFVSSLFMSLFPRPHFGLHVCWCAFFLSVVHLVYAIGACCFFRHSTNKDIMENTFLPCTIDCVQVVFIVHADKRTKCRSAGIYSNQLEILQIIYIGIFVSGYSIPVHWLFRSLFFFRWFSLWSLLLTLSTVNVSDCVRSWQINKVAVRHFYYVFDGCDRL